MPPKVRVEIEGRAGHFRGGYWIRVKGLPNRIKTLTLLDNEYDEHEPLAVFEGGHRGREWLVLARRRTYGERNFPLSSSGTPTRCEWCQTLFVRRVVGRPRDYCSRSCQQRAYRARKAQGA